MLAVGLSYIAFIMLRNFLEGRFLTTPYFQHVPVILCSLAHSSIIHFLSLPSRCLCFCVHFLSLLIPVYRFSTLSQSNKILL
jgi:hypothetical protein